MITQAVILCGGLGTRLGCISATTPKPLLPVGQQPFLQILIQEIARSGVRNFLLLAGHLSDKVIEFADTMSSLLGSGFSINVTVESQPAGTGGALFEARDRLTEDFLLFNGDSFLDFPLHELGALMRNDQNILGAIALRHVHDSGRYGSVTVAGDLVIRFDEKNPLAGPGLINGGVYLLRRTALDLLKPHSSIERDFLPKLIEMRALRGFATNAFFIDIGLPDTYVEAQDALTLHRCRPAVFLDRDGVVNRDVGHVGTVSRFEFMDGALEAVRSLNQSGYYVFIVTNQAGIAKGKYSLEDYWRLRDHIRAAAYNAGAQIDDERFCPYHPDAVLNQWRKESDWRKPGPGMLLDLIEKWPIDRSKSFLIGDQLTDLAAARTAGVRAFRFSGGNLSDFVESCIVI